MSQFYISAAHKSSGKTTLSIGLSAALSESYNLQVFKKGPDYIDPMWLRQASGKPVYNLDFYTSSNQYILDQYSKYQQQSEITLVEGNKGLFDGMSVDGSDSNAAMAKLLNIPVILVIDCQGITYGIAPLLQGYVGFDQDINYTGVILNKVGGSRHQSKLINAIETYTDLPVLGALQRDKRFEIEERHLGLIPNSEVLDSAATYIDNLKTAVKENIDLSPITKNLNTPIFATEQKQEYSLRVGIATDSAFGFYYADDLAYFKHKGVELIEFNTLEDSELPKNIDGLIIGGGFPETHLTTLSSNTNLLNEIKTKIQAGLPTYAECGGLMYLCQSIEYNHFTKPMVGIIPEDIIMKHKPQGRGYINIKATNEHPWKPSKEHFSGHEFHYSTLKSDAKDSIFAYSMIRGTGINHQNDGIVVNNLVANYCHLRQTDQCHWIDDFISFIKNTKF